MDALQKAWMDDNGFTYETLKVVQFHDELEDRPWFYRQCTVVGTIQTVCEGWRPIDPEEVLRIAREGFPFPVGVMYKSVCSDQSALNGSGMEHLTATMLESWQFSIDFGLVTPYQSDAARPSPIKKFEFKLV